MKQLRFRRNDISKGNLILVNPAHPYAGDLPKDQVTAVCTKPAPVFLERQTAKMLAEAIASVGGRQEIIPVSGYRTLEEQQSIFHTSLREHGEEFTRSYVAIPGCSEHQTGLAVDLARNRKEFDAIRPDFPYVGIWGQFRNHAVQYGFVERYPAGKERITKIAHEPWHFRYVGYPHSELMLEGGLTLEEYMDCLKNYPYQGTHYHTSHQNRNFEIFYVPVCDNEEAVAEIPDQVPYQASGNNEDGFVVTLWRERL